MKSSRTSRMPNGAEVRIPSREIAYFRQVVWTYWKEHGRHDLPWRSPSLKLRRTEATLDPYKILVSEMMLQQTQVSRVIGKYGSFIKQFPTAKKLAAAPLSAVLKEWSGLGYNRRAKYLHEAAKKLSELKSVNKDAVVTFKTHGLGPYTKDAVLVFAYNEPRVLIETNIRTVYFHHFGSYFGVLAARRSLGAGGQNTKIADHELSAIAGLSAKGQDPRTWHWALMDYGAYLKQSGVRNNHKSARYTKQSKFEGSLRQVRGAILRELHKDASKIAELPFEKEKIESALLSLARDGLIKKEKEKWRIA